MSFQFKTGSLVNTRGRDWIVQPSPDPDLLVLRPLGGTDAEIAGIYFPLEGREGVRSTDFRPITPQDLGDFASARLLHDAARLAFRQGAGPFRSLAKLSFRPRAYQLVPLIMALRQTEALRLLIADDVGVGKTIEALLIVKELLERRLIHRFAVLTPPHLCDQWQRELSDKFGIEAVVIRSNTQARLDRDIHGDESVFHFYPFQIISMDYIKGETRRAVFLQEAPELILVDEAHTCAKPQGASTNQQQRHRLLNSLAQKSGQGLILLTATPHSGKDEEFRSLLGLLNTEFADLNLVEAPREKREAVARHLVQRRRADVKKSWGKEETRFPRRDSGELHYDFKRHLDYLQLYQQAQALVVDLCQGDTSRSKRKNRMRYWSALALLRGIMSSPDAGVDMLQNRMNKGEARTPAIEYGSEESENAPEANQSEDLFTNPVLDQGQGPERDSGPDEILDEAGFGEGERKRLQELATQLNFLRGLDKDPKANAAAKAISEWMKSGFQPIVFCRFIKTAHYLGEVLGPLLRREFKEIDIQVITSEFPEEERRDRIEEMEKSARRLLICTDCLSEGINLQSAFTAVLHYDLPWNPNRLEQREGRVDRFGQSRPVVKAYLLFSPENPMDSTVLRVLLRKVQEIRKSTGISLPFPEDSQSLLDAVFTSILDDASRRKGQEAFQLSLWSEENEAARQAEVYATHAIQNAAAREKASRAIFAQNSLKPEDIEQDVTESDKALGRPEDVEAFTLHGLQLLGAVTKVDKARGYEIHVTNLPPEIMEVLPRRQNGKDMRCLLHFDSPTPETHDFIGRNHPLVEGLCRRLMAWSLERRDGAGPARASVIRCNEVTEKTTLALYRMRHVIAPDQRSDDQLVAEEMLLLGWRGKENTPLPSGIAYELLQTAIPRGDLKTDQRKHWLEGEIQALQQLHSHVVEAALEKAQGWVASHERFRKALGGKKYHVVKPVLPPDLLGLYLLLPTIAES